MNTHINQYCFDAITGYDGSACYDEWETASFDELVSQASAQAQYAANCYGTVDAEKVARAVIYIRENNNGSSNVWFYVRDGLI